MIIFLLGVVFIMGVNIATGIIVYSYYHGCDPVKAGIVTKYDKLMPRFVRDVAGHIPGMAGVFISCVFSASLSTVSAGLHATAGVIYGDYVRPLKLFAHTDSNANLSMRMIIFILGTFAAFMGTFIDRFQSIFQVMNTVTGVTIGVKFGVFTLGMLYPWANQKVKLKCIFLNDLITKIDNIECLIALIILKGVLCGIISSVAVVSAIVINAQYHLANGTLKYNVIPTSIEKCSNETLAHLPPS